MKEIHSTKKICLRHIDYKCDSCGLITDDYTYMCEHEQDHLAERRIINGHVFVKFPFKEVAKRWVKIAIDSESYDVVNNVSWNEPGWYYCNSYSSNGDAILDIVPIKDYINVNLKTFKTLMLEISQVQLLT